MNEIENTFMFPQIIQHKIKDGEFDESKVFTYSLASSIEYHYLIRKKLIYSQQPLEDISL